MKQEAKRLYQAIILSMMLCGGALAGPVWTCSITEATACEEDGTTHPPDLGGRARPSFLRVDAVKNEVTILAPAERRGEVSRISSVEQIDEAWVMSGVERGRPWNMIISAEGKMTLSITSDGETWSIFGDAMLEEDARRAQ